MSDIWTFINSAYDMKSAALLGLACIGIGYALRGIKQYPNGAIPLTVIILAALGSVLLQPDAPTGISARAWNTKNALAGIGIGFLAWFFHRSLLRKIEDKLGMKGDTNGNSNTVFFQNPKPENKQTNEKGTKTE